MTNLIAAIVLTLTTNVSERWPQHQVPGPYPPGYETLAVYICHDEPDKNPTNKWVRTVITEYTNLVFSFQGKEFSQTLGTRTVSDTEVTYILKQDWMASKTNAVASQWPDGTMTMTNLVIMGNTSITNWLTR